MKARAFVQNSVNEFGTSEQIEIWKNWSDSHQNVRCRTEEPTDDGTGPMASDLRDLIVDCLHKRFDFLTKRLSRPSIEEDEAADIGNDTSMLYGIACWISDLKLVW